MATVTALSDAPCAPTLTVDVDTVLAELARGQAARAVATLAEALVVDVEGLENALADLEADGLVDVWGDCPEGPAVVLSALGAERLGLQIGPGGQYAPIGSRAASLEPRRVKRNRNEPETRGYDFGSVVDPSTVLPRLWLILGLRPLWPVPIATPCPGCFDRRLPRHAYCAICDASGVDALLPAVPAPPPRRVPEAGPLVGGKGALGAA